MKTLGLVIALTASCWPAIAAAQDARAGSAASPDSAEIGPLAPAGRSESALDGVSFDLSIDDETPSASLQVGGFFVRNRPGADGRAATQSNWLWSVRATAPIGGTSDVTSRPTLDALGNGSRLSVSISHGRFSSATGNLDREPFIGYWRSALANCLSEAQRNRELSEEERQAAVRLCNSDPGTPQFARRYSDASPAAVNRALFGGLAFRVGGEASIGVDRFTYIDASTLGEIRDTKVQYSGSLFFTWFPADAMSALIGRGEYQRGYQAAEEALVCRPVVTDPDDDCVTGISGPPSRTERLNFSLEYRRVFDLRWRRGMFAISPRATIDALTGEVEAEFPIYFIPRGTSPVSPGIRATYSSERDEVVFGVFLKTTFSL